ncbi:lycopene cyclase domain-containing protein [Cellulomonas sp. HZM]|uniref:lycopene cyclase domain-containing protein n=1 Tax=Cellulomonas sp. HZM TaxID=1454010 RepID=UPI000493A31C|nr:lycopene cyclase domain-containing protein [Cellulomonas sp. HZM]
MSYLALGLGLVAVAATVAAIAWARTRGTRLVIASAVTVVVLAALTVVFDSLMVRADLFRYSPADLTGVRVWLTPVEDLAWPVAAGLLLPAVDGLLRARGGRRGSRTESPEVSRAR